MSCYKTILVVLACICMNAAGGQNTIALPPIVNYSKEACHAGTQNWDICQDKNGILYFANSKGLLTFDGTAWRIYPLPHEVKLFALAMGTDGRIYTGSQNDIGYYAPDRTGRLVYTSLKYLIPKHEWEFAEVWDVRIVGDQVFFRSNRKIFQYREGRVAVYGSVDWNFLGYSNGQLFAHDFRSGLVLFKEDHWERFTKKNSIPADARITSVTPMSAGRSLFTTMKDGLFILGPEGILPFDSPDIRAVCSKNIYAAASLDDSTFVVATNLGGCFILDHKGRLIQQLSKQYGLQNNNVLSLFVDRGNNIWLGLHKGIDFIDYSSAVRQVFPDGQEHSAGYAAIINNGNLYLGTSYGLYKAPLTGQKDIGYIKSDFSFVPDSKGQVWNLSEVNGQLFMGHNEGAFRIQNDRAVSLDSSSGFWSFQLLGNQPTPVMVTGTYNGINFYDYENGRFVNHNKHSHFESARFTTIDNNIIWAMHPFNGLYKVAFRDHKPTYTTYKDQSNIYSGNHNYLYKIRNRLILTNDNGIFEYNERKEIFEPSRFYFMLFGTARVQYLKEDAKGNIWFIEGEKLGVVDFSGSVPKLVYLPELNNKIMAGSHEFIYPYNDNNIFVAGEEGFFLVNYEKYKTKEDSISVLIRNVRSAGNSPVTYFDGHLDGNSRRYQSLKKETDIGYNCNSLHFEYSSPVYTQQSAVEYSYFLEGFDKSWSAWSRKNEKDYTNLAPGTYTFQVKARKHAKSASVISRYQFTILPPWYKTTLAYFVYLLLAVLGLYVFNRWQKRKFSRQQLRHEEEQKKIQYLHQLELEKTENEIIRLKNEKLENTIQHKNSELASAAMNLVQKGEMLSKIKEEVIRIMKSSEKGHTEEDYKKVMRMLDENKTKKDWDAFAQHFDKVHSDFLIALAEHYPNLTPGESKLCAYLRLNLSSKEIAQLMNITVKSVELGRHRLRKKLQLATTVNLSNFLATFHSENKQAD